MTLHREWADIVDPEDETWVWRIDMTLMASGYECIYGRGCPSTRPEKLGPAAGCCAFSFMLDEDDFENIDKRIGMLTADEWENKGWYEAQIEKGVWKNGTWWHGQGEYKNGRTRNGMCIFANSEKFPGGMGCTFHIAATNRGEDYLDWKPYVCWSVPLTMYVNNEERVTYLKQLENHEWVMGEPEFDEEKMQWEQKLDWWCGQHEEAWGNKVPFYRRSEKEIRKLCGDAVYEEIVEYMALRSNRVVRGTSNPVHVTITKKIPREAPVETSNGQFGIGRIPAGNNRFA